jgi:beta-xylosidase
MVWAPEVIKVGEEYRMYYTAHDRASNRQCIGVASSPRPDAAFEDTSAMPLFCPPGYQRAIDASPFAAGKQLYLYFSGVCCDRPNGVFVQRLSPDGLSTVGSPSVLIESDVPWEGTVVEAPTMLKRGGKFYLFYSGNDYRDGTYAVGYATCKSPVGPCTKARENPILSTATAPSSAIGPGHQSVLQVGDQFWLVYHAWNSVAGYSRGGSRMLWLSPLEWKAGKPVLDSRIEAGRK